MASVIHVENLRKSYSSLVAVDDLSFDVEPGEIFGMVGPNGAGKTTTIECIEGLRQRDSGRVHLLGLVPRRRGLPWPTASACNCRNRRCPQDST